MHILLKLSKCFSPPSPLQAAVGVGNFTEREAAPLFSVPSSLHPSFLSPCTNLSEEEEGDTPQTPGTFRCSETTHYFSAPKTDCYHSDTNNLAHIYSLLTLLIYSFFPSAYDILWILWCVCVCVPVHACVEEGDFLSWGSSAAVCLIFSRSIRLGKKMPYDHCNANAIFIPEYVKEKISRTVSFFFLLTSPALLWQDKPPCNIHNQRHCKNKVLHFLLSSVFFSPRKKIMQKWLF